MNTEKNFEQELKVEIEKRNLALTSYIAKKEAEIGFERQSAENRLDLAIRKEAALIDIRQSKEIDRQMQFYHCNLDALGRLTVDVIKNDNDVGKRRVVVADPLNAVKLYYCTWPKELAVFEVSFRVGKSIVGVRVKADEVKRDFKNLFKRLQLKGIRLLASRREYADIAAAVFNQLISVAEKIYLPYAPGYNWEDDKGWYFVGDEEIAMQEVLNYV